MRPLVCSTYSPPPTLAFGSVSAPGGFRPLSLLPGLSLLRFRLSCFGDRGEQGTSGSPQRMFCCENL